MSRAHREILHLARLLDRLATDLVPTDADRYLIRDAQRVIEAIEALVRLHNAQEEDIYETRRGRQRPPPTPFPAPRPAGTAADGNLSGNATCCGRSG